MKKREKNFILTILVSLCTTLSWAAATAVCTNKDVGLYVIIKNDYSAVLTIRIARFNPSNELRIDYSYEDIDSGGTYKVKKCIESQMLKEIAFKAKTYADSTYVQLDLKDFFSAQRSQGIAIQSGYWGFGAWNIENFEVKDPSDDWQLPKTQDPLESGAKIFLEKGYAQAVREAVEDPKNIIRKKWPNVVRAIPDKYLTDGFLRVLTEFNPLYEKHYKNANDKDLQFDLGVRLLLKALGLSDYYGYLYESKKFIHTNPILHKKIEERIDIKKWDIFIRVHQDVKKYERLLVDNYKITLMPAKGHLIDVFLKFVQFMQEHKDFVKKYITSSKMYTEYEDTYDKSFENKDQMLGIVIYIFGPRDEAQLVLNTLYEYFKDVPGANRAARFTGKVTDLIYISQGDGHEKKVQAYSKYFELPKYIYYAPDITGTSVDYHLKSPVTAKEVVK